MRYIIANSGGTRRGQNGTLALGWTGATFSMWGRKIRTSITFSVWKSVSLCHYGRNVYFLTPPPSRYDMRGAILTHCPESHNLGVTLLLMMIALFFNNIFWSFLFLCVCNFLSYWIIWPCLYFVFMSIFYFTSFRQYHLIFLDCLPFVS